MQALGTPRPRRWGTGTLASVAFCSALGGLLLLHLLRTDYEVRSHMISDYAFGPHGWVMTAVWFLGAATWLRLVDQGRRLAVPRG